jgi:hypothetical protein
MEREMKRTSSNEVLKLLRIIEHMPVTFIYPSCQNKKAGRFKSLRQSGKPTEVSMQSYERLPDLLRVQFVTQLKIPLKS